MRAARGRRLKGQLAIRDFTLDRHLTAGERRHERARDRVVFHLNLEACGAGLVVKRDHQFPVAREPGGGRLGPCSRGCERVERDERDDRAQYDRQMVDTAHAVTFVQPG